MAVDSKTDDYICDQCGQRCQPLTVWGHTDFPGNEFCTQACLDLFLEAKARLTPTPPKV